MFLEHAAELPALQRNVAYARQHAVLVSRPACNWKRFVKLWHSSRDHIARGQAVCQQKFTPDVVIAVHGQSSDGSRLWWREREPEAATRSDAPFSS